MICYNILTPDNAQETLQRLTGIPIDEWKIIRKNYNNNQVVDDYLDDILKTRKIVLPSFSSIRFTFSHITTSANCCESIRRYGLINCAYTHPQTELYKFLMENGIVIDKRNHVLSYKGKHFDISFEKCDFVSGTEANLAWLIGRKAYYDYGICGFLSYGNTPYPGNVHIRPEILLNIDDLLQTNLSDIWEKDHHTYEVIAQTDSDKIILDDDNPMMAYLVRAFWSAFWTNESLILLKPNIDVLPTGILEIKKFNRWKDNV